MFGGIKSLPGADKLSKKSWISSEVRNDKNPNVVDLTCAELLEEKTNRPYSFKAVEVCEGELLNDTSYHHGYAISPGGEPELRNTVMEFLYGLDHPAIQGKGEVFTFSVGKENIIML